MRHLGLARLVALWMAALLLITGSLLLGTSNPASATPKLIQKPTMATASGATSVSLSFPAGPAAGHLLVAICGATGAVTITAPSGFSTAKNEAVSPSQGIFYKVATGTEGTTALSCAGGASTTRWGMQLYEYSGLLAASTLDAVNTVSSTGSTSPASSGSVTTTAAGDLLVAGIISTTTTAPSAWSASFTAEDSGTISGNTKVAFGSADNTAGASGSYSTTATVGSASWRGQIAAFKAIPSILSADIVDGSGNTVATPSFAMNSTTQSFHCQTVTGTLGSSTQKVRVSNYTATAAWTLSMAATNGSTSSWSAATPKYDFNDPTSSGCADGTDADSLAGQLSVNPAAGTLAPSAGCTATGVSLGAASAFSEGVTDSVTIASATTSAGYNCYWDITGVSLAQTIPAAQPTGSYSIGMTLTIVAN